MASSYYQSNHQNISSKKLLSYVEDLKADRSFKHLIEMDDGFEELFTERVRELSGVISTVASLSEQHENDKFTSSTREGHTLNDFSETETKFINRFSIMYRYFRFKFESLSAARFVADELIAEYTAMCMLIGMATAPVSEKQSVDLSDDDVEKLYQTVILNFTGYYRFPSGAKSILKHLENKVGDASIRGEHSPISLNFLQKSALRKHGYQYIQLGNILCITKNLL